MKRKVEIYDGDSLVFMNPDGTSMLDTGPIYCTGYENRMSSRAETTLNIRLMAAGGRAGSTPAYLLCSAPIHLEITEEIGHIARTKIESLQREIAGKDREIARLDAKLAKAKEVLK